MTPHPLPPVGLAPPSDWVRRWAPLVRSGGTVLDVACGSGRHLRWLAAQGFEVTGVDRDAAAVRPLEPMGEILVADLEGAPWPLRGRRFDAVVVTHYLWRALWPALLDSVEPGGVLVYETFAAGHETLGRPSRPDFLLQPGELLEVVRGWRVVAYEHGFLSAPDRLVQRVCAVRPAEPADPLPARHRLG